MQKDDDNEYNREIVETNYYPFCCCNYPCFSCFSEYQTKKGQLGKQIKSIKQTIYHKGFSFNRNKWTTLWYGDIKDPEIYKGLLIDNDKLMNLIDSQGPDSISCYTPYDSENN